MPTYVYKCAKCANWTDVITSITKRNDTFKCETCGDKMKRDVGAEMVASTDTEYRKPVLSDSAGVHPSQIAEETRAAQKAGVDLQFTKDGRAIFRSHNHRKKCLKYLGMHDRDGY